MDIARYVTYYERDGDRNARDLFQALPARARNPLGVDLARLREGCQFQVNYPDLVQRAFEYFA